MRTLRRIPGFTLVALTTLALGIGANSAIFSVVYGVLLAPLPYRDADRLYTVRTLYPDGTPYSLSPPDFMSVRQESRTLEQVEALSSGVFTLLGAGEPREVRGTRVSDGLMSMLGLQVSIGRALRPEENQLGQSAVAVLDHGFWQRQFGGDPNVLGRTLSVGGEPYTIVGVLAAGAQLPDEADIYAPLEYDKRFSPSTANGRRGEFLYVIARARSGTSARQIEDDLRSIGTHLQSAFRDTNDGLTFTATSLEQMVVGSVRTPLLVLLGAVGLVLLVACANVANLLLARASTRQAELAVRAALGAGRRRLLQQLVTESVLLGLAGAIAGLAIAYAATQALIAAQPADIPRLNEVGVNGPVVIFTVVVAVLTSLVFGILPALQATSKTLPSALRDAGRSGRESAGGSRLRASLIVAEMALAVVLLMGAGLLIRSFIHLTQVDPGFQVQRGMAFRLTLQGQKYREDAVVRLRIREFEDRLRALPGVVEVGTTSVLPLSGNGAMLGFAVEGAPPPPPNVNPEIAAASVTPGYFRALGTPIRRGRAFTDQDGADARVALINEAGVRRWYPDQDPLGKGAIMNGVRREIVGIVGDVLQRQPGQTAAPQLFVPIAQRTTRSLKIVLRTTGDPLAQSAAVRETIRGIDPELAITAFTPLEQLVARSIARPRLYTSLLSLFAAVGLILSATGIFGVMSYAVAQRSREIGIRMALGAQVGDVLRLVVGRAAALTAVGLALGIAGSLALGRVIQGQLFGVTLFDPLTLATVTLVLATSAGLASFLPARRAVSLDPSTTLREG